ncbi:hypothetical protein IG631_10808 [Alternaria alternata]|nr:hypothetical protein IG631_10808 [Alternaria alternata]
MRSAGMSSARPSIMLTAYVPGQHHTSDSRSNAISPSLGARPSDEYGPRHDVMMCTTNLNRNLHCRRKARCRNLIPNAQRHLHAFTRRSPLRSVSITPFFANFPAFSTKDRLAAAQRNASPYQTLLCSRVVLQSTVISSDDCKVNGEVEKGPTGSLESIWTLLHSTNTPKTGSTLHLRNARRN